MSWRGKRRQRPKPSPDQPAPERISGADEQSQAFRCGEADPQHLECVRRRGSRRPCGGRGGVLVAGRAGSVPGPALDAVAAHRPHRRGEPGQDRRRRKIVPGVPAGVDHQWGAFFGSGLAGAHRTLRDPDARGAGRGPLSQGPGGGLPAGGGVRVVVAPGGAGGGHAAAGPAGRHLRPGRRL